MLQPKCKVSNKILERMGQKSPVMLLMVTFFGSLIYTPLRAMAFDVDGYLTTVPYEGVFDSTGGDGTDVTAKEAIDIGKILKESNDAEGSIVQSIFESLGFEFGNEQVLLQFINNLINFALAVIGLIAMVVFVYAFYKIFFSDGEEAFTDAKKLIRNAFLAILLIGLSWYITDRAFDLFYETANAIE